MVEKQSEQIITVIKYCQKTKLKPPTWIQTAMSRILPLVSILKVELDTN